MHGDDFVTTGDRDALEWFRQKLQKRSEIIVSMIGLRHGEEREGKILNRIVRVDEKGWYFEADQRHAAVSYTHLTLPTTPYV